MSENSTEFSLSNSEQRDSWLNSGHQTLDANSIPLFPWLLLVLAVSFFSLLLDLSIFVLNWHLLLDMSLLYLVNLVQLHLLRLFSWPYKAQQIVLLVFPSFFLAFDTLDLEYLRVPSSLPQKPSCMLVWLGIRYILLLTNE